MLKSLRYKTIFFSSVFLLTARLLSAQHTLHNELCGADEMNQKLWKKPSNKLRHERSEEFIFNQILDPKNKRTTATGDYVVPVVVHIIHQNGAENISDAAIITAIQHMNDAFNNAGSFANPLGTATGIQFCIAKQDEQGNATSGITRHSSTLTNLSTPSQDMALKNIVNWDPTRYVNIWIVKEITSESAGPGVAGYAYFPSAHGTPEDGLVCEARYFAGSQDDSKVAVHELGHYFGLYHTFEGGCVNTNCLLDGDRVCDTAPDGSSSPAPCGAPVNSCNSDSDDPSLNNPFRPVSMGGLGDQPDPMTNYMDYGNDACRILFSLGQKDRMVTALTGLRASLLESNACVDPCPNPIQVSFSSSATNIVIGTSVQFTNTSTGGAIAYEWSINGTLFSSAQDPAYTFNQQGTFVIKLKAFSSAGGACTKEASTKVTVNCPLEAVFKGPASVRPAESMVYTNTTQGTNTYQWLINGSSIATSQDLTHTFGLGGYSVSLVAFNGQCYDTSRTLYVQSATCNLGNESKIWYFGNLAGLDFTGDTAVPIPLPFSIPMIYAFAMEACVSMSDASGNHLFFANPEYAFNRNHVQMPNGAGLLGSTNATQMAAVHHPSNPNLYYLFTVGALDAFGNTEGLRYSVIDMTLDGGLGDVVVSSKNTLLLSDATEKVCAVKHANGVDTWVVVHERNTNNFFSYLVTAAGVTIAPVITPVGPVHAGQGVGQLKFSPDGCKVALAKNDESSFELYNFNNQTGILSSPMSFTGPDYEYAYGVEFSPDGSKLYIAIERNKNIFQFDMSKTTAADIAASRVFIANIPGTSGIGALQIGPYGKIYMARTGTHWLGTINNPNAPGVLCEFKADGVSLGSNFSDPISGYSTNGLPCFSQQYFYDPKPVIIGPDTVCVNRTSVTYKISGSSCSSFTNHWSFMGRGSLTFSNDTVAVINFSGQEGIDTLIATRLSACGTTVDTLFIHVRDVKMAIADTIMCTGNPIVLDAGPGFVTYEWQDHSMGQTFSAPVAGKYWVHVTTKEGCSITDTIHVRNHTAPHVALGPDIARCPGKITVLDAGNDFTSYQWQDHSTEQMFSAYLPGKYWVTVTDACGSTASDTLIIAADMDFSLGGNKTLCAGETIVLNAGNNYTYYQWQDHSAGQTYHATQQGTYWVVVSDGSGCYGYDTVQVYKGNDCCTDISIPSLITPNNDGKNESFEVSCIANNGWLLEIYNRWGSVVYRNENYSNNWNAENNSDGVYFYLLKKKDKEYRGWIQVTR